MRKKHRNNRSRPYSITSSLDNIQTAPPTGSLDLSSLYSAGFNLQNVVRKEAPTGFESPHADVINSDHETAMQYNLAKTTGKTWADLVYAFIFKLKSRSWCLFLLVGFIVSFGIPLWKKGSIDNWGDWSRDACTFLIWSIVIIISYFGIFRKASNPTSDYNQ
jgi:hypothetical protein